MNKQKMWLFAGIILSVLIISGSISYAFFTASVTHNNQEAMVITSGSMKLTYADGTDSIALENAIPGMTATKTFSVENTGSIATSYSLNFTDVLNTFVSLYDLSYNLEGFAGSSRIVRTYGAVPFESKEIASVVNIDPGVIHYYTLTITFNNRNLNQNNEQGKTLNMKIGINDLNYYPVTFLVRGEVFNKTLKQLANPDATISYGSNFYDTKVTAILRNDILDTTKEYAEVSTSDSKYPVYVWYDEVEGKGVIYYYTEAEYIYLDENSSDMFGKFKSLTSLDLSDFNTSRVANMTDMFSWCINLTSLNISSFDTSNVTDMNNMFSYMYELTSLNISNFDTSKVSSMYSMFCSDGKLQSLDLSNFNTSNVTDMGQMFHSNSSLTTLKISNWDVSKVKNMKYMFYDCSSLTSLDLSGFTTSSLTNISSMFSGCSNLTSLNLIGFDTSNVTDMSGVFNNCSKLTSLNISSFNTSKVTRMDSMFCGCSSLTSLDLSDFETSLVNDMGNMFKNCSNLNKIYVDSNKWIISSVTSSTYMFTSCSSLVGGAGTAYSSGHTSLSYAHVDEGESNPGYLTLKA